MKARKLSSPRARKRLSIRVTREIGEAGGTAIGITLDVGDRTQINEMVADTREAFGLVSVPVNDAQSWGKRGLKEIMPPNTPIESIDEWDHIYFLNWGQSNGV